MPRCFYVTGTDTEVGKTFTSVSLLQAANRHGMKTLALKPVASGAAPVGGDLRNEDALALRDAMSVSLDYQAVNPYCFAPAIAPHIAARQAGSPLSAEHIVDHCRRMLASEYDFALIEGAGGWRVPLNEDDLFSDIPTQLKIPVILVVGMRLGCINHALLTAQAMQNDGVECVGWVANSVSEKMPFYDDNILYLKNNMPFRMLGEVPFSDGFAQKEELKNIYNKIYENLLCEESGLD